MSVNTPLSKLVNLVLHIQRVSRHKWKIWLASIFKIKLLSGANQC